MSKYSRLVTTTVLGAIFGVICILSSKYTSQIDFWPLGISFFLQHTVMGLAIGTSSLKMHWAAHGTFWGAVFGLFLAISVVGTTANSILFFVLVVVWGFLIETITTKAFKRPQ
jgi:hypothetical protein